MRKVTIYPQFWYNPNAKDAYNGAYYMMNGSRWPEAEPFIIKYPLYALDYARFIITDRFYDAEPYLKGSLYQTIYEKVFKCKL